MYIVEMITYLLVLAIVTFQLYDYASVEKRRAFTANVTSLNLSVGSVGLQVLLDAIVVIYCLRWLSKELWEMIGGGLRDYLGDGWNWLELPTMLLMLSFSLLDIITATAPPDLLTPGKATITEVRRVVGSLCGVLMWLRLLYFLRGFSGTGPFVRIVLEIVKDMKNFLLLLLIVLGGFATGLVGLFPTVMEGDFMDGGETLLTVFRLMVMDFDRASFEGAGSLEPLAIILFCLFILIVSVILFNLLITLMGDTYDRVAETLHAQWRYDQADLMLTLQRHRVGWVRTVYRRCRRYRAKKKANSGSLGEILRRQVKSTVLRERFLGVFAPGRILPSPTAEGSPLPQAEKAEHLASLEDPSATLAMKLRPGPKGSLFTPKRMLWLHVIRPARETSLSGAKKDSWQGRFHAMKQSFQGTQKDLSGTLRRLEQHARATAHRVETIEAMLQRTQSQLHALTQTVSAQVINNVNFQMDVKETMPSKQKESSSIEPDALPRGQNTPALSRRATMSNLSTRSYD